jgi:hypothetical protein
VSYILLKISRTDIALFTKASREQQPSGNKGLGMEACPFQKNWPVQRKKPLKVAQIVPKFNTNQLWEFL